VQEVERARWVGRSRDGEGAVRHRPDDRAPIHFDAELIAIRAQGQGVPRAQVEAGEGVRAQQGEVVGLLRSVRRTGDDAVQGFSNGAISIRTNRVWPFSS